MNIDIKLRGINRTYCFQCFLLKENPFTLKHGVLVRLTRADNHKKNRKCDGLQNKTEYRSTQSKVFVSLKDLSHFQWRLIDSRNIQQTDRTSRRLNLPHDVFAGQAGRHDDRHCTDGKKHSAPDAQEQIRVKWKQSVLLRWMLTEIDANRDKC